MTRKYTKPSVVIAATMILFSSGCAAYSAGVRAPSQSIGSVATSASFQQSQNNGQWIVLANGCAYSKTQAPGYAPVYFLIQNPHHLGLANAPAHCAQSLK